MLISKRRLAFVFSVAALAISTGAFAQDNAQNQKMENHFASKIHHVNQMEIKMGEMAAQKAVTPEVKNYANKLIQDHKWADDQLMKVASDMKLRIDQPVSLDSAERKQDADTQGLMRQLNASRG